MYFMHGNITFRRNVLHGIKNGHFIPFYQKIVGPDESVCAVEVLLRWNKNGRMLVGPTEFIDKADKLGLLSPIVENAMEKVINDLPLMSIPIGSVISINGRLEKPLLRPPLVKLRRPEPCSLHR